MLIDERQITGLLEEIVKTNNGTISIKDASGQVILSAGETGMPDMGKAEDKQPVMTVSSRSARSGWEYVSVVPEKCLWKRSIWSNEWPQAFSASAWPPVLPLART